MALIKCENVSIGYEGQTIVRDLNFEIGQGDDLCIVGENGSGKSTLVKSLLGLKAVDSGKIEFGDGLKQKEIGYLPQQNDFQKDFPASVYEVVLSGRLNSRGFRPFYTATDKAEAAEKMEMLGITDLRGQCFRDLSGGQKQRVLLARALCATKKLLLLDEPVSGIDQNGMELFFKTMDYLKKHYDLAIILISHDLDYVARYADHVVLLDKTVLRQGTVKEVYESSEFERIFSAGKEETWIKEDETND